ncbi:MAG: hypothetical protein ACRD3R_05505, partial [Terriglobales bacterium]
MADDTIPWWEDAKLQRQGALAVASLAFLVRAVISFFSSGTELTTDQFLLAFYALGGGVAAYFEIRRRIKAGRN